MASTYINWTNDMKFVCDAVIQRQKAALAAKDVKKAFQLATKFDNGGIGITDNNLDYADEGTLKKFMVTVRGLTKEQKITVGQKAREAFLRIPEIQEHKKWMAKKAAENKEAFIDRKKAAKDRAAKDRAEEVYASAGEEDAEAEVELLVEPKAVLKTAAPEVAKAAKTVPGTAAAKAAPKASKQTCSGFRNDGIPCKCTPLKDGNGFCYWHQAQAPVAAAQEA